ncbi:hypothetical protein ACFLSQ_08300 [Bacteroidota bacterium]
MATKDNGWEMRNITDKSRINDMVEQYESLGFEVRIENFDPEKYTLECNECMTEIPEKFKVIFTKPGVEPDEDLFDE